MSPPGRVSHGQESVPVESRGDLSPPRRQPRAGCLESLVVTKEEEAKGLRLVAVGRWRGQGDHRQLKEKGVQPSWQGGPAFFPASHGCLSTEPAQEAWHTSACWDLMHPQQSSLWRV